MLCPLEVHDLASKAMNSGEITDITARMISGTSRTIAMMERIMVWGAIAANIECHMIAPPIAPIAAIMIMRAGIIGG